MSTPNSVSGYYPGLAAAFLSTLAISALALAFNKYSLDRLTKRFNYFEFIRGIVLTRKTYFTNHFKSGSRNFIDYTLNTIISIFYFISF